MPYTQGQLNDMYNRVLACLDAEFADLPKPSGGDTAAQGLRDAIAAIQSQATAQAGFGDSAQVGTGQRGAARRNIKTYRQRLAQTALVVANKKPGFNQDYPFPSGETDNELITNTRAVAAKALTSAADFTTRGIAQAYLESGTALVDAFEAALDATNTALSHKGAATGGKKSSYREADEHLDELDIFIRNHFADQPDKLNAWRVATHIERAPKKSKEENPPTP